MREVTEHSDSGELGTSEYVSSQKLIGVSDTTARLQFTGSLFNVNEDNYVYAGGEAITTIDPSHITASENQWLEVPLEGSVRENVFKTGAKIIAYSRDIFKDDITSCGVYDSAVEGQLPEYGNVHSAIGTEVSSISSHLIPEIDPNTGHVSAGTTFEADLSIDQHDHQTVVNNYRALTSQAFTPLSRDVYHMKTTEGPLGNEETVSPTSETLSALNTDWGKKGYLADGYNSISYNQLAPNIESQIPVQSMVDGTGSFDLSMGKVAGQVATDGLDPGYTSVGALEIDRNQFRTDYFADDVGSYVTEVSGSYGFAGEKNTSHLVGFSDGTMSRGSFDLSSPVQTVRASGKRWERQEILELIDGQVEGKLAELRSDLMQLRSDLGERRFQQRRSALVLKLVQLGLMFVNPITGATLATAVSACQMAGAYGEEHLLSNSK